MPGQTGQTSPAAWSQTVMTRSILGASGPANSSQDLLRAPASESPIEARYSATYGLIVPPGRLPAL